jgi:DUF1365 family protein
MFSGIYAGWVRHRRLEEPGHAFRNRIYLIYLDLDELDEVFAGRWLWSVRRAAPFRFHRRDHFGDPAEPLAQSVQREIQKQTGESFSGTIRLLTQLRHFGFVFNPVSFYYCFRQPDSPQPDFIVAEVNNTPWGQRHCYVLKPEHFSQKLSGAKPVEKVFHVSPFMNLDMEYAWHLPPPDAHLSVDVVNLRDNRPLFDVTMQLERRKISTANLTRLMFTFPFSTFRIFAQIYWQALRLWWKRVPFVPHPAKGQPHGNQGIGKGSLHRGSINQHELSAPEVVREVNASAKSRDSSSNSTLSTLSEATSTVKAP